MALVTALNRAVHLGIPAWHNHQPAGPALGDTTCVDRVTTTQTGRLPHGLDLELR